MFLLTFRSFSQIVFTYRLLRLLRGLIRVDSSQPQLSDSVIYVDVEIKGPCQSRSWSALARIRGGLLDWNWFGEDPFVAGNIFGTGVTCETTCPPMSGHFGMSVLELETDALHKAWGHVQGWLRFPWQKLKRKMEPLASDECVAVCIRISGLFNGKSKIPSSGKGMINDDRDYIPWLWYRKLIVIGLILVFCFFSWMLKEAPDIVKTHGLGNEESSVRDLIFFWWYHWQPHRAKQSVICCESF